MRNLRLVTIYCLISSLFLWVLSVLFTKVTSVSLSNFAGLLTYFPLTYWLGLFLLIVSIILIFLNEDLANNKILFFTSIILLLAY